MKLKNIATTFLTTAGIVLTSSSLSFAADAATLEAFRKELQSMKQAYESRIADLENKIEKLNSSGSKAVQASDDTAPKAAASRRVFGNSFNPSIGVILNGKYSNFSENSNEIKGFAIGEEGERGREGLAIDESELNFSASVDDKFKASVTAAIVHEDGEDKIELEEAYAQTLPGLGLPEGLNVKFGRSFWTLGYLNGHHAHADDFADRPLPNRVFLNKAFNDDGIEASYVLPTPFYSEIGGGLFRGDDFPGGSGDGEGASSHSFFARVGGDIGHNQSWRLGASWLGSESENRTSNEDTVTFIGDSDLYVADFRYTFAPTGNAKNQELILQGEYFYREEKGTYEGVTFNDNSSGWYAQSVYKFHPQWRVGYRYTQLNAADVPAGLVGSDLDSGGYDPYINSVMLDWTNSEFSRLRLQYNNDKTVEGKTDNQIMLQYIMSLGAHGAHKF